VFAAVSIRRRLYHARATCPSCAPDTIGEKSAPEMNQPLPEPPSADRYKILVEQSLAGMYVIEGTSFVYVNARLAEMFGYSVEELTGLAPSLLVHPADRDLVGESLRRRLEGERDSDHYTFRGMRKDGTALDLETLGARAVIEGKALVVGTILDVTERRRADDAIRESEERYALAAQGASDGLWDWDVRAKTIYFSDRWRAQIGLTPADPRETSPAAWLLRVHADDRERLVAEIRQHLEARTPHVECEYRLRHEDGSFRWMLARGMAVRDGSGRAYRLAGSQTDITGRKRSEEKLAHDALHDALTGLPNRSLFMDRLSQAMAFKRRRNDSRYACVFLDLDRFKTVNESLGHSFGDRLLSSVGKRLLHSVRPGDTVARLGGDEFCILFEEFSDDGEPLKLVERLLKALLDAHVLDGTEIFAQASAGIALGQAEYARPEDVVRDAEIAMYRAKEQGRGSVTMFQASMQTRARAQLQLETDLRRALERDELRLVYQPVIALATGQLAGCEALCTWDHPVHGHVSPAQFIPIAEETGLIVPLGAWALREACRAAVQFGKLDSRPLTVAVNLSARQLVPELLEHVRAALSESGLPANRLQLELTESLLIEHAGPAAPVLAQLKNQHVHLLLDDFGTGYSSLGYLHDFRFDALKIDRSFVARAGMGKQAELLNTIVSLARTLGMEVVAEGVETAAQAIQLQALGAQYAQGFFFSRSVEQEEFARLVRSQRIFKWSK
jgi:diguanylate cyclase (GGDEF)-like protein/PAS domain S-box-containing protein